MKPAITMSLPVPIKARVLMLASFAEHGLTQIVDFNQGHARGVVLPSHDRGVRAWIQGRVDGCFEIVGRGNAGGDNGRFLRGIIAPVVIDDGWESARAMQFQTPDRPARRAHRSRKVRWRGAAHVWGRFR